MSSPWVWSATADEVAAHYDCASLVSGPRVVVWRAIDVAADAASTFRWVCQLKVAPYSYDLVDNLGRRSPVTLTPGAAELAVGQKFLTLYRIAAFSDREITAHAGARTACTYRVVPVDGGHSRIVVRLDTAMPQALHSTAGRALAWGDLVMMRHQLHRLAGLAGASPPDR